MLIFHLFDWYFLFNKATTNAYDDLTIINEINEFEGEQYFSSGRGVEEHKRNLRERRQASMGSGNYDTSSTTTTVTSQQRALNNTDTTTSVATTTNGSNTFAISIGKELFKTF